jgi:hypothetical protein
MVAAVPLFERPAGHMRESPAAMDRRALAVAVLAALVLLRGRSVEADDSKGPAPAPPPAPPAEPSPAPEPGKSRMFDPRFREGRPFDVLAAGTPPLLRGTVDAFVDYVEAAHVLALSAAEEQTIRDGLETAWPRLAEEDRRWFERQVAARDRLRPAPGAAVDTAGEQALLSVFLVTVTARVAKSGPGAWESAIRRAIERRAAPFSAAPPPSVSVADLDAFEELVMFLVSVARNSEVAPTEGQRIAVRPSIRRGMDASSPELRKSYARMHRLWPLVKARWDAATDEDRLKFRWAIVRLFRRIAKLPIPSGTVVIDLPGYASSAAEVAAAMNAPDAYTSAFANPSDVITTVVEGLGMDPRNLEPVFVYDRLFLR